jgi:hypothetical protein
MCRNVPEDALRRRRKQSVFREIACDGEERKEGEARTQRPKFYQQPHGRERSRDDSDDEDCEGRICSAGLSPFVEATRMSASAQ